MLKTHKIPGIEKAICTAEQKICYNFCFSWTINPHEKDYVVACIKKQIQGEKDGTITSIHPINWDKYNTDLIIELINMHFERYAETNQKIFSDYESLGKFFYLPE